MALTYPDGTCQSSVCNAFTLHLPSLFRPSATANQASPSSLFPCINKAVLFNEGAIQLLMERAVRLDMASGCVSVQGVVSSVKVVFQTFSRRSMRLAKLEKWLSNPLADPSYIHVSHASSPASAAKCSLSTGDREDLMPGGDSVMRALFLMGT